MGAFLIISYHCFFAGAFVRGVCIMFQPTRRPLADGATTTKDPHDYSTQYGSTTCRDNGSTLPVVPIVPVHVEYRR